mgnify:CR=1 FL=1
MTREPPNFQRAKFQKTSMSRVSRRFLAFGNCNLNFSPTKEEFS